MIMDSSELLRSTPALPEHEARRLLVAATGRHWTELVLGAELAPDEVERFEDLVRRRVAEEPLQYIEGTAAFGPIEVVVDPRVLIPRPETEQLFEIACNAVDDPKLIVDLCTGSGNLAIALKYRFPGATVYATDLSQDAVDAARENARRSGLDVSVFHGDLFEPLPEHVAGRVDLVVANPPYIAEHELESLPADVRDHEPVSALVSGPVGDEVLARIAATAPEWLAPDGVVVCEISEFLGAVVAAHFSGLGGEIRRDLSGKERFVIGARHSRL
jgi:release factor glutamine methyltransferase